MLQRHLHAVQWNLKNPLLSSYLEECAHRLLYIKGSFWKYTLVLTYSFYWIFFFLQLLWSLYWLYTVEFGSSELLPHTGLPSQRAIVLSWHLWMAERNEMKRDLFHCSFISCTFLLKQYLNGRTSTGRKCSIKEQRHTKAILCFLCWALVQFRNTQCKSLAAYPSW